MKMLWMKSWLMFHVGLFKKEQNFRLVIFCGVYLTIHGKQKHTKELLVKDHLDKALRLM